MRTTFPARMAALATAVTLLATGALTAVATSASAAAGCAVTFKVVNSWSGGYQADVAVRNVGDPLTSWTLTWTLASGQGVTQAWNATVTTSGTQATARNVAWNGNLGTNAGTSFGFIGSGPTTSPTTFAVNGTPCTGTVSPTASPSASPTVSPTVSPTAGPTPTDPGTPPARTAEHDGADCPVTLPASYTSNAKLPDPFTRIDGTRVATRADWRCRRAEIKELAEATIYGDKPAKPATVTGSVTSSQVTVNVAEGGRSASFTASVSLPSGTGPFPAVIVVGSLGADTATIRNTGVAVINYDPYKVGAEGTSRSAKSGAFYTLYGSGSRTGLLQAWGWGVSRIIDVVEASGGSILRTDSFGVTGCSRFGKGTIVAGAFDQRIDLVMPIESGTGGVPILRGVATESGAQGLNSGFTEQPWLGDAFSPYVSNPAGLPVDTHETLAMVAPRGLFVMENPGVDWLGTRSGSVSALAAREVYTALGATSSISYISSVSNTTHCATRTEWTAPLQANLRKFLLGQTNQTTGTFSVATSKQGNLADWRTWTTPSLG